MRLTITAIGLLALGTVAITIYMRNYYLPMREAKPILQMLNGTASRSECAA